MLNFHSSHNKENILSILNINYIFQTHNSMETEDKVWGVKRQPLAVIMMAVGSTLLAIGFIFTNQKKFHPVTAGIIRGFAGVVISFFIAAHQKIDLTFSSSNNFKWQIIRNGIMFFQGLVYAWSQFYLPLPIVVTLYSSTPIFTALFDYWVYGVSINQQQKIWLIVAFVGVVLTSNGSYLKDLIEMKEKGQISSINLNDDNENITDHYLSHDSFMKLAAGIILAITQFFHGLGVVVTKKLIGSNAVHITYFVGLILLLTNSVLAPLTLTYQQYHFPNMAQMLQALAFTGIPLTIGMLCFNGALTLTHHYGVVAPFQFASIVVGYLISIFRYGQELNWICIIGTIAICVGIIFILRNKQTGKLRPTSGFHRQTKFSCDSEMI